MVVEFVNNASNDIVLPGAKAAAGNNGGGRFWRIKEYLFPGAGCLKT
jgi:hypothetical protein